MCRSQKVNNISAMPRALMKMTNPWTLKSLINCSRKLVIWFKTARHGKFTAKQP